MIEILLRHKFILLFSLIACIAYQFVVINRAHVDVTIQVEKRTPFKIYWAGEGQGFSERRMAMVLVKPDRKKYSFFLTDLRDVQLLRIDPLQYAGTCTIEKIRIKQNGHKEISVFSLAERTRLKPISQIKAYSIEDDILEVQSSGKDPNFSYEVHLEAEPFDWSQLLIAYAVIICCTTLICSARNPININHRYVFAMLTVVLALVITMALISERDVHPDESVHMTASNYYRDHWLPPAVDDESIRDTYSKYGSSRLNTNEIYYLLNGKFTQIIGPLQLPETTALRMFNVFLICLILLYTLRVQDSRLVAVPLLITAQAWYLFSYCNSDAFALTIAFFVGCQVVMPESALNSYLYKVQGFRWRKSGIWVILLFCLLFLLKKNYYAYAALVFLLIFLNIWQTADKEIRKTAIQRFLILCLLSLSLLGVKRAADTYVNDFDRTRKIISMRNQLAVPMLNPTSPLDKQLPNLSMKKRGYSVDRLINKERWFEKSFRSAFGVYGYFTISGGYGYYDLVRYTGVAFLVFFFGSIVMRAGSFNSLQALSALALAVALIAASFYHSWTKDFQAQGRYLLPILPMMGIICAQNKAYLDARLFRLFVAGMFALSVYSFIWVALLEIPRVAGL